jgi:hypothetical protein
MERDNYLDRCLVKDPSIVARTIAGDLILVPIRHRAGDIDSIYTMNQVGCRIWELVDGQRRVEEIRDVLVDEFEVGPDEAETDLVNFLLQLEQIGAVKAI